MGVNISSAANSADLLSKLASIDISVPPRTEGRTTSHTETWAICHLLSTLTNDGQISFPMSLSHRDRPDFLVESASITIGIEVTEAISKNYAAYCALAEREFPDVFLQPSHFRWGRPELSLSNMRTLLQQDQLTGDGWSGDKPEQEWALFIQSIVDSKLKKLAHNEFNKFDQNWLLIYDNLPLPHVYLKKAIGFLCQQLEDRWSSEPAFDVLFIEHGPVIAQISASEVNHLTLSDLWE